MHDPNLHLALCSNVGMQQETDRHLDTHLAICCHSNETRVAIANPPNNAQLQCTSYHTLRLHLGPCGSVGIWQGTNRHTDVCDHYTFASSATYAKCNDDMTRQKW